MSGPVAVLIGPMGAGKTTVGRLLADQLGCGFRDTDVDVERRSGRSISDIFVESGEPEFRALERAAVAAAVAEHDGVLALGGGAVLAEETRALLDGLPVVYLRVGLSDAVRRVGLGTGRPLLLGNVRTQVKRLLDERDPVYLASARWTVDTDGRTAAAVADDVLSLVAPSVAARATATTIPVEGPQPYLVQVGHGLVNEIPSWIASQTHPPQRVALAYDRRLAEDHEGAGFLTRLRTALAERFELCELPLPSGEQAKSVDAVSTAWERLGRAGFTRSDWVVTCGGGAVTDVGGFIAATWLRGVPVVHVPTTVLAMVDAAVGGKTGMNTESGKNLVGAFHEPAGVWCDLDAVTTLPVAEIASGLAEAIKCGFIADPAILDLVERLGPLDTAIDRPELREIIERAIRVKAVVVAGDLREMAGLGGSRGQDGHPGRETLNYGHTLAHAIEKAEHYRTRHGEAVAVGCVFVAEVAHRLGLIDGELLSRHRTAFAAVGLPVSYTGSDWSSLRATMAVDKKSRGSSLRLVVLQGLGMPRILADPPEEVLLAAATAIGVRG